MTIWGRSCGLASAKALGRGGAWRTGWPAGWKAWLHPGTEGGEKETRLGWGGPGGPRLDLGFILLVIRSGYWVFLSQGATRSDLCL